MRKIKELLYPIRIWEAVYAVLFSIMCVLSRHVVDMPSDRSTVLTTYFTGFQLLDILFFICALVVTYFVMRIIEKTSYGLGGFLKYKATACNKKDLIITGVVAFLVISIAWIPYLMSYWPGGIYNDTLDSINIALSKQNMSNQNTVLYALFWRLIFWIGQIFDQGEYGGLKLMSVLQPLIMILVAVIFLVWLRKNSYKKWFISLILCVFALMPVFPYYGISLWKDTLFSINLFILTFFLYSKISRNNRVFGAFDLLIYSILSLLVIFGRNNGIFIIMVLSAVISLVVKKYYKKQDYIRFVGVLIGVIVLSLLIMGPVYKACGVEKSGKAESYGIALQQTGYMISSGAKISEKELAVIEEILPLEGWINLYNPTVADSIKFDPLFNKDYFEAHTGEFVKAYSMMAIKNPALAVKGYFLATIGFWDAWKTSSSAYICRSHCYNAPYFMSDYFNLTTNLTLSDIVGPRWYISSGLLVWIMLGTIAICMSKRKYLNIICIVPTFVLWGTLMLATPLAFSFRYVFALLLCMPIYLLCITE